jgi:multidrug efflux system membrane fusion protein
MLKQIDAPELRDRDVKTASPGQTAARKRGLAPWLMLALAALAIAGGLAWWRQAPKAVPEAHHEAAVTVSIGEVTRGDMPVALDGLGTVTSLATVTLRTQISGRIMEVGFKEGQAVKAGDFLVQIDPRPYQAALDQVQGQLARDEALLGVARLDQARYETLIRQDSIARQQVETQRALVHQDEAIVRSDKAAVETAKLNLDYCRILSPVNGRVGLRIVDPGNYVQPGDANGLVVVTQTQPISVIFPLPQDTIPQFITQLRGGKDLPVLAYNRAGTDLIATGVLSNADNQVDTTTGTVRLRANFANDDEKLYPNQFVNVKLIVDTLHDAAVAPTAAVQLGAPGNYVYLADKDGTVSVRPVTVGPSDGQRVAILKGLQPGDSVIVDGADRLRDGAKFKVAGAPRPDKSSAAQNVTPSGGPEAHPQNKN